MEMIIAILGVSVIGVNLLIWFMQRDVYSLGKSILAIWDILAKHERKIANNEYRIVKLEADVDYCRGRINSTCEEEEVCDGR